MTKDEKDTKVTKTTKKIPKKIGPNEKIPVQSNGAGKITLLSILIGSVFSFVFMALLFNGKFDSILFKDAYKSMSAAKAATTSLAGSKTIPINLPPKITAVPKNVPKSADIKGPNEPGYRVSGGETPSGEKGWIKEVVTPGDGKTFPKKGDVVVMHYVGKLANGKVFDSSRQRGQPFRTVIGVGRLIKGWDEGIPTMSLGESAVLSIQPEYGYGARGAGASIPPNSELIFEVELLEVIPRDN